MIGFCASPRRPMVAPRLVFEVALYTEAFLVARAASLALESCQHPVSPLSEELVVVARLFHLVTGVTVALGVTKATAVYVSFGPPCADVEPVIPTPGCAGMRGWAPVLPKLPVAVAAVRFRRHLGVTALAERGATRAPRRCVWIAVTHTAGDFTLRVIAMREPEVGESCGRREVHRRILLLNLDLVGVGGSICGWAVARVTRRVRGHRHGGLTFAAVVAGVAGDPLCRVAAVCESCWTPDDGEPTAAAEEPEENRRPEAGHCPDR